MPVTVLVLVETINDYLPILEHQGFHLILAPTPTERAEAIARHTGQIDAVLTRGPLGLYADEIAALPNLKIICVIGAGYEHVDLQAAANRGHHRHQWRRGQRLVRRRPCHGAAAVAGTRHSSL